VIVPCYNEAEGIDHCLQQLKASFIDGELNRFEFVFVDDHSADETPFKLLQAVGADTRIKMIRLSAQSGSHVACRAGLQHASGDVAVFMDADLQEGVALIFRALEAWREGYDVVYSIAEQRDRGGWIGQLEARLFYALLRRISQRGLLEDFRASAQLVDRKVIDFYCAYAPRRHNFTIWIAKHRFYSTYLFYMPSARKIGQSKWTFSKKLILAIDSLSDAGPAFILIWLVVGSILLLFGTLVAISGPVWFTSAVAGAAAAPRLGVLLGWTTLLAGLVLLALGTIGMYVWRIYEEMRNGPEYTVQWRKNVDSSVSNARLSVGLRRSSL
jgi:dolichol-phosphate mannosyltransferase